ncbi:head-tail connector protein [Paraeggerthella sp.]|uniref:head-tail connector protein n=1 Tax=Paraeggerthella sp. TaxID=2897350 RepID=UPI003AB2A298
MKLSEMQESMILNHLRLHPDFVSDEDKTYIEALEIASIAFVEEYCNIDTAYIDAHEELTIAVLVLIGDMYDNRTRYVDKANLNRTVETILSLHDHNLIDDAT